MDFKFSSKFQIDDPVMVDFQLAGIIKNAVIKRIIRAKFKTYYDIEVLIFSEDNQVETTLIKEVDEFFIHETLN